MTFIGLSIEEAKAVLEKRGERANFIKSSSGRERDGDTALIMRERSIGGEWELTFAEFRMKVKE